MSNHYLQESPSNCVQTIAEREAVMKYNEKKFKKEWQEDAQFPSKLEEHHLAFSKFLTEFNGI